MWLIPSLGYALTKVSFDLDVMSLKNINLDQGIDYFLGIFRNNLNEGVFHNVTYLDLSNTTIGLNCEVERHFTGRDSTLE